MKKTREIRENPGKPAQYPGHRNYKRLFDLANQRLKIPANSGVAPLANQRAPLGHIRDRATQFRAQKKPMPQKPCLMHTNQPLDHDR